MTARRRPAQPPARGRGGKARARSGGKARASTGGKARAGTAGKARAGRSSRAPARRSVPARSAPARTGTRRGGRLRRAAQGDRPYAVVLFGLLVLIGTMALGPLQNYTAAADRVETLERTRDQLSVEVDDLEERRARLDDLEEIETRARTQLGLVRPGEIPFVVVTPEEAEPRVGPEPPADEPGGDAPWYRRIGRWLAERAGAGR